MVCGGLKALGRGRWRPGKCHSGKILVKGTIVDTRNRPVPGVLVTAWDVNPGKDTNVKLGWKKTDARGNFQFETRAYRDKGNPFPDVRLTVEVAPQYTYPKRLSDPCWKRKTWTEKGKIKWRKFCWRDVNAYLNANKRNMGFVGPAHYTQDRKTYWKHRSRTVRQVGKLARIAVWPAKNKQLNDHNPSKNIVIPRGMIRVPVNEWDIVRTTFDPRKNGFSFVNMSRDVCWGPTCKPPWFEIFRTRQALCGGFSLMSLKRFLDGKCDTNSRFKQTDKKDRDGRCCKLPADLKKTLVMHQMETFFHITYVDRGIDVGKKFNINALKFLAWQAKQDEPNQQAGNTIGKSTKPEWAKIRIELKNRKLPVVIGQIKFKAAPGHLLDINGATNNHQVLAIGYDHNPQFGSVTLYIYDPNHPNRVSEIRFNEYLYHSKMFIDYFHYNMDKHPIRGFFMCTKAPAGKRARPKPCP
jgi:hypothetical protein